MEELTLLIQAVATFLIAGTFIVYWRQLRTMQKASDAENFLALINFVQASEVREARFQVRRHISKLQRDQWSANDEEAASLVASTFDIAGMLIRHGLVPPKPFLDNWGPTIVACYEVLGGYIQELRQPDKSGPNYWKDYDWPYEQAKMNKR
ncbi:MAG: hypothetical protein L0332_07005 [Chloroflexi bacterium]|nr:hypothetical protein [Chloroflexota bacterium]MCI0647947.1 hypothetical protein [Chloroflexota bacterium]MCI0726457.1 hypothetical protein [Chloroflexota bacterium]